MPASAKPQHGDRVNLLPLHAIIYMGSPYVKKLKEIYEDAVDPSRFSSSGES